MATNLTNNRSKYHYTVLYLHLQELTLNWKFTLNGQNVIFIKLCIILKRNSPSNWFTFSFYLETKLIYFHILLQFKQYLLRELFPFHPLSAFHCPANRYTTRFPAKLWSKGVCKSCYLNCNASASSCFLLPCTLQQRSLPFWPIF